LKKRIKVEKRIKAANILRIKCTKRQLRMELPLIYANNEPKPMLACDFEEYRDGE